MKNSYVQAFIKNLLAGMEVELALTNLKQLLKNKGHERLWSQILRAAARELPVALRKVMPQIVLAKSVSLESAEVKAALLALNSTQDPRVVVDPTLIGGFTARLKDNYVDQSYKSLLLGIYRKVANGQK